MKPSSNEAKLEQPGLFRVRVLLHAAMLAKVGKEAWQSSGLEAKLGHKAKQAAKGASSTGAPRLHLERPQHTGSASLPSDSAVTRLTAGLLQVGDNNMHRSNGSSGQMHRPHSS